jgi:ATP-dependent Lhr-like helicase
VEGLGGSQFALPGAIDRLRQDQRPELVVLAAADPANPYGATLGWPEAEGVRLARDAGAYVLLYGGVLIGFLERGRKSLTLLTSEPSHFVGVSQALAVVAGRHRRTTLSTINGRPAQASPLAPALAEWGFATAVKGLTYRG